MPNSLEVYSGLSLQPKQNPSDARLQAGQLGVSLTLARGTVLAKQTSTGKLVAYNDSLTDGQQVAVGILQYDVMTDASGNHYLSTSSAVASSLNPPLSSVPYFVSGTFDTSELTGYDAAALVDFKGRTLPNGYILIPN